MINLLNSILKKYLYLHYPAITQTNLPLIKYKCDGKLTKINYSTMMIEENKVTLKS